MSENDTAPPPLDATAASRWQALAHAQALRGQTAWLHEEVGRRMSERLGWIKREPASWVNWRAMSGAASAHVLVQKIHPNSKTFLAPGPAESARAASFLIAKQGAFKSLMSRLQGQAQQMSEPVADGAAQMVWANMSLHTEPDPAATVKEWHRMLAVDGYLMFSCLGPDTARELQAVYQAQGWGPTSHPLTDMHDWGDLLVGSGFAEPVMDMERLVLTFASPERALAELRGLGRNLHPQRFAGLRGRAWHAQLLAALRSLADAQGQIALTFELIYGHAFKPAPRLKVASESAISMQDMRAMLSQGRAKPESAR